MGEPFKVLRFRLTAFIAILSFCSKFQTAHGLHCYVCSSDTLSECSSFNSLEDLPIELCPADVTSCFTKIEHGTTIRGCLSPKKRSRCDDDLCKLCRSNKCNDKIFPEDRLSCLHCEGSSCVNQANTVDVRYPCKNYQIKDECYSIFSPDGSTAYRGCMSDLDTTGRDYCLQNYAQCMKCAKRGCNSNPLKFEKKMSCVKCTPDKTNDCSVIADSTKATECAPTTVGYSNLCYMYQNGIGFHRGCLYDAPEQIFAECSDRFSEACSTCNKSDCNRNPALKEKLTINLFSSDEENFNQQTEEGFCYKCDSNKNKNCVSELDDSMIGMCPEGDADLGCYHKITAEGRVLRGCIAELQNDDDKRKCLENDSTCKTCFESKCNSRSTYSQCFVTDQTDEPSLTKTCKNYKDDCFIQVVEENKVIRDCVGDYAAENNLSPDFLSKVENKRSYGICSGDLCNDKTIKQTVCLECNSNSDAKCIDDPSARMYNQKRCDQLEVHPSGCYHFSNESYTERGCISHLDAQRRGECESDSDNCKRCVGENCNNRKIFLKCHISDHADYTGLSKTCKRYENECFIHASGDVVRRGCLHDRDTAFDGIDLLADCRDETICERCSFNNCNSRQVSRERCITCERNSEGIDCIHYPTLALEKLCPFALKPLGCYLRQDETRFARGCTSSLKGEERLECQHSTNDCKVCFGDNCNIKKRFPLCADCSTAVDGEDCQMNAEKVKHRECPDYMDQCYVRVENGILERNCTNANLISSEWCKLHPQNCLLNPEDNEEPIESDVCADCDSSDEKCQLSIPLDDESLFKKCQIALDKKGCYHYIGRKTKRHTRGCVNELTDAAMNMYSSTSDDFKTCQGFKCNTNPSHTICMVCNSTEDVNCAINPSSLQCQKCKNYRDECFTLISFDEVIRGCLNEHDEEFQKECKMNSDKCEICPVTDDGKTNECNDKPVNVVDTCIQCDSAKDPRCRSNPEEMTEKICDKFRLSSQKGCYLSISGNNVARGCVEDLPDEEAKECLSNSDKCKICTGKNCNTRLQFQECFVCNSRTDPQCARIPRETAKDICDHYGTKCLTEIDSYGYTNRQCILDELIIDNNKTYETCEANNCNKEIIPADRLRCYQCSSDRKCDTLSQSDINLKPEPCAVYSIYEQCFTFVDSKRKMHRGCLSDTSNERLLCEQAIEHKNGTCSKCTQTGCNNQKKYIKPQLSCVKCNGSEECAFGQDLSTARACEKDIVYGDVETCFTLSSNRIKEVKRGCTFDEDMEIGEWCREGCEKCLEDGCNIQNGRYHSCVRCQSDIKGDCAGNQTLAINVQQLCDFGSSYPYSKRGCFTSVKDGNVTRGCIVELSEGDYDKCKAADNQICSICTDDNCNTALVSSSMALISASGSICFSAFLITYISNHKLYIHI